VRTVPPPSARTLTEVAELMAERRAPSDDRSGPALDAT
jgi:hypothetical protein